MTTHTTEADLLRAIVTDPHDIDARLVYADWLDDHGQEERGQWIREAGLPMLPED